jgi:hypothetical protein
VPKLAKMEIEIEEIKDAVQAMQGSLTQMRNNDLHEIKRALGKRKRK